MLINAVPHAFFQGFRAFVPTHVSGVSFQRPVIMTPDEVNTWNVLGSVTSAVSDVENDNNDFEGFGNQQTYSVC
jgi:hypothetical protein